MKELLIRGEYIRLCDAVKFAGEAETGGEAKTAVAEGKVTVNGETCLIKGKKLAAGDTFSIRGEEYRIVV